MQIRLHNVQRSRLLRFYFTSSLILFCSPNHVCFRDIEHYIAFVLLDIFSKIFIDFLRESYEALGLANQTLFRIVCIICKYQSLHAFMHLHPTHFAKTKTVCSTKHFIEMCSKYLTPNKTVKTRINPGTTQSILLVNEA